MSPKLFIVLLCATRLGTAQTAGSPVLSPQSGNAGAPLSGSPSETADLKPKPADKPSGTPSVQAPASGKSDAPAKSEGAAAYVIGSLDVLGIKVWGNANITGIYDVRSDGMLSMPLVGEYKADGLTVQQLKTELAKRLDEAGIIKPDVDIQVLKINSKRYYVTGAVKKSGEFPISQPITILDAIILAGGTTDFAKQKRIYVLRDGQKFMFNYKDVINGKNMDQNITLKPNDRIVVPE